MDQCYSERVANSRRFALRKKCLRTSPLGVDAKGNTYWMFTQRDKKDEDWGQWVVVEKNASLPHPSGVLPEPTDEPAADESDVSGKKDTNDDDASSRIWYAVSGAQNIRNLAEWIKYQTDLVLFARATAANSAVATTIPDSPLNKSTETPSRKLMVEVRLPRRTSEPIDPVDFVTKESTEALCSQLQKIAGFMELNEDPQKLI